VQRFNLEWVETQLQHLLRQEQTNHHYSEQQVAAAKAKLGGRICAKGADDNLERQDDSTDGSNATLAAAKP
jgi:hypothetical protein